MIGNVQIYSRAAMEALLKTGRLKNTAVISFYDPPTKVKAEGDTPVDYAGKCDRVFPVALHDIDRSYMPEYGLTYETYFPEVDDLATFVYRAVEDGLDIICQCEYGQSRSAATAAAILEHFEGKGLSIFADERYYPNQAVYHKVFDALEKVKKERDDLVPAHLIAKAAEGKKSLESFEQALAQAIRWYKKNCHPHQAIIIADGLARLVSDEMGVPFEVENLKGGMGNE